MQFDILTIFPKSFDSIFSASILKRAQDKGIVSINFVDIRGFCKDKHKQVDDYPYGGGCGMIIKPEPLAQALDFVLEKSKEKPKIIYLSPQGHKFNQEKAFKLSCEKHIILICGRYEGIDERIIDLYNISELSIGDYILSGGEIPAMVVVDSLTRLLPNALGNSESKEQESFKDGLLEFPQYTRPQKFRGKKVDEILISGNHKEIDELRRKMSLKKTYKNRPDLIEKAKLLDEDKIFLKDLKNES